MKRKEKDKSALSGIVEPSLAEKIMKKQVDLNSSFNVCDEFFDEVMERFAKQIYLNKCLEKLPEYNAENCLSLVTEVNEIKMLVHDSKDDDEFIMEGTEIEPQAAPIDWYDTSKTVSNIKPAPTPPAAEEPLSAMSNRSNKSIGKRRLTVAVKDLVT